MSVTINSALAQKIAAKLHQGFSLHSSGQLEQARVVYEEILRLNPRQFDAMQLLGALAIQTKQWDRALNLLTDAIKVNNSNPVVYNNRSLVLKELNQLHESLAGYEKAINLKQDYAEAHYNRGVVLQALGRMEESLDSYGKAIKYKIDYAKAYNNRGIVLNELKRLDESISSYDKAIEIKRDYADAYNNRGNAFQELELWGDALKSYDYAIEFNHQDVDAYFNRGNVLQKLKRFDEAVQSYEKAIEFRTDHADAYNNRGNAFEELEHLDDALASFDKAIKYKSDHAVAFYNRGNVLSKLKRFDEALISYSKAVDFKRDYASAYNNLANILKKFNRFEEAIEIYGSAIECNSDYVEAFHNLGLVLQETKKYEIALINFKKVLNLKPDYPFIKGEINHCMMQINDWQSYYETLEDINRDVLDGKLSATPFGYQAICNEPRLMIKAAEIFSTFKYPKKKPAIRDLKIINNKKIKIAYVCGEFRDHATSILMVNLWEMHNKDKFEVFGLDNGWDDKSPIRKRIKDVFNQLIDITAMSDLKVAQLIYDENIDILVNLNVFFGNERNSVFSYKAAPIQVNYLGFPGTMGVDYMDYLIADKTVIPENLQEFYTEKIVYLPNCYQVNDRKREIADKAFTKEELGLPNVGFVFCCFNNNYKITPPTFDGWVRILKAVEGSVLWLLEDNPSARTNLQIEAKARGLDPNRLVFAKRLNLPEHLARHKVADLFLDTLPSNAHTTASDALWAGLPVLTCMGHSFASRVAASLLKAMQLPELITASQDEYETTAIELATYPEKLHAIKEKIERNRLTTALFDTPRFTKHIESAFTQMYERYQADLPPDHLHIEA